MPTKITGFPYLIRYTDITTADERRDGYRTYAITVQDAPRQPRYTIGRVHKIDETTWHALGIGMCCWTPFYSTRTQAVGALLAQRATRTCSFPHL